MKKIFPVLALAAILTSCKKDYTCTCLPSQSFSYAYAPTTSFTIEQQTKKNAEAVCSAKSNTSMVGTYTVTVTCSID